MYVRAFWVDPVAVNETFSSLLDAPQAGLVIIPRTLPVTVTVEMPAQTVLVVDDVMKMVSCLKRVLVVTNVV